ncbi:hypothetical protein PUMCH_003195 [Australozyma saopauloensis]|uniref:WAC domain-containing protein n=1 Tax=Australozyma saopauloensis TaxID=291208 RepID=A0AAX4HBF5_9ASCO|nr:hypothetical protein PUMCH_003195 [[Candida] saopauloensis]
MVLYKKKQVTIQRPRPLPEDLSSEIFVIPQTKEWFFEYEEYLARMDFYKRHQFSCEITGASGLTYFDAYAVEQKEYKECDANFPESLREHILKFLLFNKVTRLDLLVDKIYLLFKNEYFPGEEIYVKKIFTTTSDTRKGIPATTQSDDPNVHSYISTVKQRGIIREKVQYSNPSDTKYLVSILGEGSQVIATNQQISRDRNHFTKWLIKVFIKMTVTRSYMSGSPWVVKIKYAKKYRIPREFPEEFKQYEASTPTGSVIYDDDYEILGMNSPSDAPAKKVRGKYKPRGSNGTTANGQALVDSSRMEGVFSVKSNPRHELRIKFPPHHLPATIQREIMENNLVTVSSFQPSKKTLVEDLSLQFDLQTLRPAPSLLLLPQNALVLHSYIAEELEEQLSSIDGENIKSEDDKFDAQESSLLRKEIQLLKSGTLNSIQEALECWMFLNIYHSVLKLDTFTFDDFLYAMSWNVDQFNESGRCELLDEIWCAVLGAIISNQTPPAKFSEDSENIFGLQIILPINTKKLDSDAIKDEEDDVADKGSGSDSEQKPSKLDDDNSDDDSSSEASKSRNSLPKRTVKKEGDDVDDVDADDEEDDEEDVEMKDEEENAAAQENLIHNAYQVMNHRGTTWYERLRKRNFKDGNWQTIVLGVLSLVEYVPEYFDTIQKAFKAFAPKDGMPASPSTVLNKFYHYTSVDLRIKILTILVSLVVSGPLVRNYIEECLDSTTAYRREKLDIYKELKLAVDNANKLHSEIYEKLMVGANSASDASLWSQFTRKRHRLNLSGYEMTDYEKDLASKDSTFQESWDNRESAIVKIKEIKQEKKRVETQLSELDCQRVSLLGKDRHFNRYWWFENNGLPNLHSSGGQDDDDEQEPESEDEFEDKEDNQEETYLMGRLWIQGPYSMDASTHMKLDIEACNEIAKSFDEELETIQKQNQDLDVDVTSKPEQEVLELDDGGPPLRVMNFRNVPDCTRKGAEQLGITFSEDKILLNHDELIDRLGAVSTDSNVLEMSLLPRKFIEESPIPLVSSHQWMYFDRVEDLDGLLKWLNPWGKRESILRKELLRVKEGVCGSISSRRKALCLDKAPKDDLDIESQIEAVEAKVKEYESGEVAVKVDASDSDDGIATRKRGRRGGDVANKKQKTTEETLKSGSIHELMKLRDELKENQKIMKSQYQENRVLEWTNSSAREEFNKSLYEGGDKSKEKQKKSKK